ncbi:MAG: HAD-IB family phosphatase [Deltaproteobacteria bacterium]|nr:HAD-IB family phosphatase [Deltaproteobacteria bacterium]
MINRNQPWQLVCFDLDGTLVHGTTTCLHLSRALGHEAVLSDLESRYARGEISNSACADIDATFYVGLPLRRVEDLLNDIPMIAGINETVRALELEGIPSLIATVTWKFAAEIIARRFGFLQASGTEMAISESGILEGRVSKHFDEFSKLEYVRAFCSSRGIDLKRVVAIGDSRSDIPLFGAVGRSVALNATAPAKAAASHSLDTNWLPDVLALLR